ncbi:hypothetical protein ACEWF1_06430 [Bifidobacterium longum subsp. longum]|jgi:hypothetical protein|nr:hypothetical protein [Bifidobacterium longum]MBV4134352.1 hypothetical protein [Bifidobacterium longum]
MTLRNGFPAVSDAADQFDIRAALRATTAQDANGNIKTGVSITAKSLTGLVTAGNGMNSDIAAFDAVTNRYGPVWLSNDGTISVKHAAAPSANSRIDLICIKQNETASPASDPTDGPEAIIVTGTPAVDPVTPATPEGALALARVTIPSTATSMTSTGVIYEQMYPFTASAGADLLFRSETEKDAWTPWEGQKCRLLDGNEYQAKSGVWVSLTQPLLYAKFKWQDTKSFQPDAYGGGMQIVVDERNRLLHADLSGFKSTVNLSHDYPVFQYASGVKPSKAVSLGCLWALPVGNWAKQATWNANGTIMVVGGLSNGDRCMHTPRTLPIPDGVTFS